MDAHEATKVVFTRIQALDPNHATKIMGFLLIQDHGEKEMIWLAFGPEAFLQTIMSKERKELGLLPSPGHRQSALVNELCFGGVDVLGWKRCLYYACGYCKRGRACRFMPMDSPTTPPLSLVAKLTRPLLSSSARTSYSSPSPSSLTLLPSSSTPPLASSSSRPQLRASA